MQLSRQQIHDGLKKMYLKIEGGGIKPTLDPLAVPTPLLSGMGSYRLQHTANASRYNSRQLPDPMYWISPIEKYMFINYTAPFYTFASDPLLNSVTRPKLVFSDRNCHITVFLKNEKLHILRTIFIFHFKFIQKDENV